MMYEGNIFSGEEPIFCLPFPSNSTRLCRNQQSSTYSKSQFRVSGCNHHQKVLNWAKYFYWVNQCDKLRVTLFFWCRQKQGLVLQHSQWSVFITLLHVNWPLEKLVANLLRMSLQAYAAAKFADACLRGLQGDANVVECSFVDSQVLVLYQGFNFFVHPFLMLQYRISSHIYIFPLLV